MRARVYMHALGRHIRLCIGSWRVLVCTIRADIPGVRVFGGRIYDISIGHIQVQLYSLFEAIQEADFCRNDCDKCWEFLYEYVCGDRTISVAMVPNNSSLCHKRRLPCRLVYRNLFVRS